MSYSRGRSMELVKKTLRRSGLATTDAVIPGPKDPVDWMQSEFWVPELAGPMVLHPYQQAVLREAYRRDERGHFVYSIVLWGDIKKSIKSCIAAAVCLERARQVDEREGWGSVHIVANDLKQADSREAYYARRAIELNPRLRHIIKVRPSSYKITMPNNTVIEPIPIDPTGEAGGNDDLIVFTELWGANSSAAERMWTEMTLSPTKKGQSQRWVETYAGFSGESNILENLWELGTRHGQLIDEYVGYPGLEVYANHNAGLLCLWNTKRGMLEWQTEDYYRREAAILTISEFNRVHGNQWSSASQKFVPDEWWAACLQPLPPLDLRPEVVVSLDAAIDGDCFGMMATSRHGEKVAIRQHKKWIAAPGQKIRYGNPENPADRDYPEGELRWWCENFDVIVVGYDQYQLHDMCTRLSQENLAYFEVFDQGKRRMVADKGLYDAIREQRIIHSGEEDITEHVQNSNSTADGDKTKLRIVKRSNRMKIDLCITLSMCNELAHKYLPE